MRILRSLPVIGLVVLTGWAISGLAAETTGTEPPRFCLPLNIIDSVDIIDEQHIAFITKTDDYYLNELPNVCPMLNHHRAIMYSTPLNSLCSLDIITVLDSTGGGFQSMGSCGLGKFQPVTREDIQVLKGKKSSSE